MEQPRNCLVPNRDSEKNETWQNDGYFSNLANLSHNKSERSKWEQSATVISLTMAAMAELAMHIQSCDSLNSKSIVPISNFIIWNGANFYKQIDLS